MALNSIALQDNCTGFDSIALQDKYHSSGQYPSSCLLYKSQLNPIGLSVLHKKNITSPLRAQQVNIICTIVTMMY
jgi:hypothetical protein